MERQSQEILAGTHLHQRALTSLIEDGGYHARLLRQIREFRDNPFVSAEPMPAGLVDDPLLMLAMDQFKDLRGFTSYAARLPVGAAAALGAWLAVITGTSRRPNDGKGAGGARGAGGLRGIRIDCCDADLVERWISADARTG